MIILLPTIAVGQDLNDSLLTTFYNLTLNSYFSDTAVHEDQEKFGSILIQTDLDTSKLVKNIGANSFLFYSSKTPEQQMLSKPYKNHKDRSIYRIEHKSYGQDTIDVNIGGWTIGDVNKKHISLGRWCGGTMGYIPDGRFAYSIQKGTWIFITGQKIMEQKLEESQGR